MANRPRDGFGGTSDIDDSDPFADLARIIGFDPRDKVARDEAEPVRERGAQAEDEFDLKLDEEPAAASSEPVAAYSAESGAAIDTQPEALSDNESFEPNFFDGQSWDDAAEASPAEARREPEARAEPAEDDLDFDLSAFEQAEDEDLPPAETVRAEPDFDLTLDDFDLDETDFAPSISAHDEQAVEPVAAAPAEESEAPFEIELDEADEAVAAPLQAVAPQADLNLIAQEAVESSDEDDFGSAFDLALEQDASEPQGDAAGEPAAPAASSSGQDYELIDQHFDLTLEDWDVQEAEPVAAAQPVAVHAEHGSYEPQGGYDTSGTSEAEAFQAQIPAYAEPLVNAAAEPAAPSDEPDLDAVLEASFEDDLHLDLEDAFAEEDFALDLDDEPQLELNEPSAFETAPAVSEEPVFEPEELTALEPEPDLEDVSFDAPPVAEHVEAVSAPEPEDRFEPDTAAATPDFEDELAALLAGTAPVAATAIASPKVDEPVRLPEPVEAVRGEEPAAEEWAQGESFAQAGPVAEPEEPEMEPVPAVEAAPEPVAQVEPAASAPAKPEPGKAETSTVTPPEPVKPVDDDPFAALAAMAARYRASRSTAAAAPTPASSTSTSSAPTATEVATNNVKGPEDAMRTTMQPRTPAPEIETVDVLEQAVALPDDLDIPEMHFEERSAQPQQYDDLDNEFAELLNEMSDNGRVPQQPAPRQQNSASWGHEDSAPRAPSTQDYSGKQYASGYGYAVGQQGDLEEDPAWQMPPRDDQYDDYEDELVYEDEQEEERRSLLPKPGTLLALLIGGVVLAGGGYFALGSGGMGGSGEPAIIKADATPLKQRPENPGGTVVPNQNSKVYERVSGDQTAEEQQTSLISTNEAPVDLNSGTDEPITEGLDLDGTDPDVDMTGKSEDRLDEQMADQGATQAEQGISITPYKVKTMVVRADGTIAPASDDAPAAPVAAVEPAVNAARAALQRTQDGSQAANVVTSERTGSIAALSADDAPAQTAAAAPTQVAALAPGAWAIQLASVPSQAAAQSTYDSLTKKYGSVLNGRGVNIVKADVTGKGTFWRVRVPTQTRDEAVQLCTNLKSAGGTCFVSK
ncbi:MAG: SPOR domain-containing protein [Methylobacterium mesophilicum]|nr:SPOR domain-containing protein [Methylobacterium mesophilicum]